MLRTPSPVETYRYINGVVKKFNDYVEEDILPKLGGKEIGHDQIITGLHYIAVNKVSGYDKQVLEILTTSYSGAKALSIYEASLEAARTGDLGTETLVRSMIAAMITQSHRHRDPLFEQAIFDQGSPGGLASLDMIKPGQRAQVRRRLVALVRKAAKTKSPYSISKWVDATDENLADMKANWEARIDPDGKYREALNPPPLETKESDEYEQQEPTTPTPRNHEPAPQH